MNKPAVKTAAEVAALLHKKGLEPNKWNHIPVYFGLRDTFRLYVNEPMKGNINIELARICGLYEQSHEKKIGTYSDLDAREKRYLVTMLERGKFDLIEDESEQYFYRVRNFCDIDCGLLILNMYNSRIDEDDTRYICDRW